LKKEGCWGINKMEYTDFLQQKRLMIQPTGLTDVHKEDINPLLFDFQRDIVMWALQKGKAAIFAGTGLGKTFIQLEWAKHIYTHTNTNILILAPLAVTRQTRDEGKKLNISVNICNSQEDVKQGINITNYDKMHKFDLPSFSAIVLDESSILKSFTGKKRNDIITAFRKTPYRLACTATPAPNDHMELGNHAEFIGVMTRTEMLSTFFVHDGGSTMQWRLKGHAIHNFWNWIAEWAVMLSNPSDLGYEDNGFILPSLNYHQVIVDKSGYYIKKANTLTERRDARRNSINPRVEEATKIANADNDACIIWCDLNAESAQLKKKILEGTEIRGSHSSEYKEEMLLEFSNGNIKKLITKPSIAGFGMNWQHCNKIIFVGMSDSFERYYQAIRRCWRFGQRKEVNVYVMTSEKEGRVVENIKRKEKDFDKMLRGMIMATQKITADNIRGTERTVEELESSESKGEGWRMVLGDSVEQIQKLDTNSIDYSIFSPPFSSLYTYSNSERDMGNCRGDAEFFTHFGYLASELFRVLKQGRIMSIHCMNLPTTLEFDGHIGIRDFRGDLIKLFQKVGFIYHSEVCIWKDPVTAMHRTKALGLLHKQLKKDSCRSRQGLPDYLISFRKPGDNLEPVSHTNENFPVSAWQNYASPIWMDINPSDTLQFRSVREENDERHIAPLQLPVIKRGIDLWTNEGDIVLDPFAGIGSTGHIAVKYKRRFLGMELKAAYYNQAVSNLKIAEKKSKTQQLSIDTFLTKTKYAKMED
jgi:DNA modification methylase/superfamily II DNA or RNA helicase